MVALFSVWSLAPIAHGASQSKPRSAAKAQGKAGTAARSTARTSASAAPQKLSEGVFLLGEMPGVNTPGKTTIGVPGVRSAPRKLPNTGALLLKFCRSYLGYKLGNGQCSELAALGLPAVGARLDWNRLWGAPVCDYGIQNGRQYIQLAAAGVNPKNRRQVNLRPGDIVQYENVKFERVWASGSSVRFYPHHTSVIERVSDDGHTVQVLEQNVNGTQFVLRTALFLPDLTEGTMHITRPIPN